jgi:hypothetical protein
MRTVYRPFSKVITVAGGGEASVELRDSEANVISCNFVSVESVSGTAADGYIYVQPTSGLIAMGTSATTTANPDGVTASGMLGVILPNLNGIGQLVLGVGDRVNTISLINTGSSASNCVVTYGNVNVQNTIKDVNFGRGS